MGAGSDATLCCLKFFLNLTFKKIGELFVPTISYRLHYGQSQTPVLEIIPDPTGLYRIAWPDIGLSDLANLADAAPIPVYRKTANCRSFGV
jgi:hypothetical protein